MELKSPSTSSSPRPWAHSLEAIQRLNSAKDTFEGWGGGRGHRAGRTGPCRAKGARSREPQGHGASRSSGANARAVDAHNRASKQGPCDYQDRRWLSGRRSRTYVGRASREHGNARGDLWKPTHSAMRLRCARASEGYLADTIMYPLAVVSGSARAIPRRGEGVDISVDRRRNLLRPLRRWSCPHGRTPEPGAVSASGPACALPPRARAASSAWRL